MHPRPLVRAILLVLLTARVAAAPETLSERWYLVEMAGAKAGHSHEATHRLDDGTIRVVNRMALAIARGPVTVEVSVESESLETGGGDPVSMRVEQRLGAAVVTTELKFEGDTATVIESQFGQQSPPRSFEIDDDALMPYALSQELKRRIARGDETITLFAIDPMSAGVTETMYTKGASAVVSVAGRAAPATRWTVEQSAIPGVETVYFLDERGEVVRGEIALGGIAMTMLLTERELALAENDPAELLVSTLIQPDRPITNPRGLREATYLIRSTGRPLPDFPEWANQRVERIDERTIRVQVHADGGAPLAAEHDAQAGLRSSTMIDAEDEQVRSLARDAARELRGALLDDPFEVARACGRFVHRYIDEKSLDVGFATASEVARTKQGDCTEHAVLLAAILRARGIPARVATGLIYVDEFVGRRGVFGFHMWTQALVPDAQGRTRWVDLDATLPDAGFDAAHIAVGVSTLSGNERMNTMAAVAPLLGATTIEIESLVHDDEKGRAR